MKTLLKTALIASAFTSMAATAAISDSDTNTAVFNIAGTVQDTCKVKSNSAANASSLVIDSTQTLQSIGTLEVWCNTGRNATTTYSSANKGKLVNADNKEVAYTLDVGNIQSGINLSTDYTAASTDAGTGVSGASNSHDLKIKPLSTGLEYAGEYTDTITVTVSPN